jgi:hypothetical protein
VSGTSLAKYTVMESTQTETLNAAELETLLRELDKQIALNPTATPDQFIVWERDFTAHLLSWRNRE